MHQVVLGKTAEGFIFSPDPRKNIEADYLAFPTISDYQLGRLLLGTPEEIQQILSTLTNL